MNRVAVHTPHKWLEIGIELEIPHGQLQAYKQQHQGESTKIFVDVFNYWEKRPGSKPKTWSTVIDALRTPLVGEQTLAHNLESEMSLTPTSSISRECQLARTNLSI